jgi:hypothetical protein
MTTQPSDWAVAQAFWHHREEFHRLYGMESGVSNIILDRARELDASGGGEPVAWANPSDIHCLGFEDGNSYPGIRRHADERRAFPLYATPRAAEAATTNSAQISSSLVVGDWLPIESAPRDGTRIILGRPDEDGDGGGISVCGYWIDELEDGVDYMGNDGGFTDVDYQVFQPGRSFGAESYRYAGKQPTHWRPLPAAPQAAMGAVGATEPKRSG